MTSVVTISRRAMLASGLALAGGEAFAQPRGAAERRIAEIERQIGGRIGVSALDTGSDRRIDWRADERFALCSTFKLLLAAAVLSRVDRGEQRLGEMLAVPPLPLLPHSPDTEPHAGGRMSIEALCHAAVTDSDNTAANLLLDRFGGPRVVTAYARSLGDGVTRLDRKEPALNLVGPGELRDTTTPAAMAGNLQRLMLGKALSERSRASLERWMVETRTADHRLRAGLPAGWKAGDKTGTGPKGGGRNDVAILWPPGRAPIIAAVYTTGSRAPDPAREAAIAQIGRVIAETF